MRSSPDGHGRREERPTDAGRDGLKRKRKNGIRKERAGIADPLCVPPSMPRRGARARKNPSTP